jgi:hypothetical protein
MVLCFITLRSASCTWIVRAYGFRSIRCYFCRPSQFPFFFYKRAAPHVVAKMVTCITEVHTRLVMANGAGSRYLKRDSAELASRFEKCCERKGSAVSFEAEYTYPDGSTDMLRVGRSCKGFCLSRSTFQQSTLRIWKNSVTRLWWRRLNLASMRNSSKLHSLLARMARNRRNSGLRSPPALKEARRIANYQVFETLRNLYSPFFGDYNHNLVLRERISGGAQGEIRAATWRCDDGCEYDAVVKIFNGQYPLQNLSPRMLTRMAELEFDSYGFHNLCLIFRATLLRDGRFAMVMRRYSGNLRKLINLKMQGRVRNEGPPFLNHEAKYLMHEVAKGMNILHTNGILHRDLNPSNVLTLEPAHGGAIRCYVADFECNRIVVGTGFFRSPEVLQCVKMRNNSGTINNSYQTHSDVYSFGMTCYELCTGLVPLQEVDATNYDFVLAGGRPVLPGYIDPQVRKLIERCWDAEPSVRPTFGMIVDEIACII